MFSKKSLIYKNIFIYLQIISLTINYDIIDVWVNSELYDLQLCNKSLISLSGRSGKYNLNNLSPSRTCFNHNSPDTNSLSADMKCDKTSSILLFCLSVIFLKLKASNFLIVNPIIQK